LDSDHPDILGWVAIRKVEAGSVNVPKLFYAPEPPPGYRYLKVGEVVAEDDQIVGNEGSWWGSVWFKPCEGVGRTVTGGRGNYMLHPFGPLFAACRKIEEKPQETTSWDISGVVYTDPPRNISEKEIGQITEWMLDVIERHGMFGGMGSSPSVVRLRESK
jgi:hypothetical protein